MKTISKEIVLKTTVIIESLLLIAGIALYLTRYTDPGMPVDILPTAQVTPTVEVTVTPTIAESSDVVEEPVKSSASTYKLSTKGLPQCVAERVGSGSFRYETYEDESGAHLDMIVYEDIASGDKEDCVADVSDWVYAQISATLHTEQWYSQGSQPVITYRSMYFIGNTSAGKGYLLGIHFGEKEITLDIYREFRMVAGQLSHTITGNGHDLLTYSLDLPVMGCTDDCTEFNRTVAEYCSYKEEGAYVYNVQTKTNTRIPTQNYCK